MSWKFYQGSSFSISKERAYSIIRSPIITEKSSMGLERNETTFRVSMDASKPEIKAAIEMLFDVKVESVNSLIQKGKQKRFRGRLGRRSDYKKAVIRLKEGQSIDIGAGA